MIPDDHVIKVGNAYRRETVEGMHSFVLAVVTAYSHDIHTVGLTKIYIMGEESHEKQAISLSESIFRDRYEVIPDWQRR